MTKAIRTPALVVRAFNVEVARIQDQTTDPQTAAFRLQFWQDALTIIYKKDQSQQNIPANPIAQELYKVCSCYSLPRRHLERLVTSRSGLIKARHFRSLEDLERYAEDAVSPIYYLLLNVAGIKDIHADHAASHLGKAQGIANILRSIYVSNHHKMMSLPMDILMKYGISQEEVLRGIDSENMRNVTFEIASQANSHLEKVKYNINILKNQKVIRMAYLLKSAIYIFFQARKIKVPKIVNQIFLPATGVDAYLKKLQKANFNIFEKSLQKQNTTLPFSLYYRRLTNKY
ncbi:hypothetical protein ABMA28_013648 [Loxostege sticticalis]|uniref:NADH dehydrogenase (Ubiquinone) complex I, assembly factor 6 n=1 Tax=Loxostege sticticalis TaxID=481309 RepID=A0ABD0TJ12_LOXSC